MEQFTPKVKLLSAVQVSEWLGIPVATLATLRSRPGRHPIPFIRIGKTVRYSEKEILKWIDANTYDRAGDYFGRYDERVG